MSITLLCLYLVQHMLHQIKAQQFMLHQIKAQQFYTHLGSYQQFWVLQKIVEFKDFSRPLSDFPVLFNIQSSGTFQASPPNSSTFQACANPVYVFMMEWETTLTLNMRGNQLFRKLLSGISSECQNVWIQTRPDFLSDLIWVQTLSKSYQETTLVGKEFTEFDLVEKGVLQNLYQHFSITPRICSNRKRS